MNSISSGNPGLNPDRVANVYLHRDHIGFLCSKGLTSWFVFDARYRANPERHVLSLGFEEDLSRLHYGHDRLPSWFSNLLPEGQLRRLFARAAGVSDETRFFLKQEESVLYRVGLDLPGAVQVVPGTTDEYMSGRPVAHPPADPKDADEPASMSTSRLRFSVAGVGMKLSMLQAGGRFTAPASGIGGKWLVKLPDPLFGDLPLNEFSMMTLAKAIGIDVPDMKLVHRDNVDGVPDHLWGNEEYAYAIQRFDRTANDGMIHIEDFAQVRGVFPSDKYSGSFETLGALFYRGRDEASLSEFVRRLALNILIGNGDAHLKNWSLIYRDSRIPTISPAYDIVSVAPYEKQGIDLDIGLRLANRKRFDQISLRAFERMGRKIGTTLDLAEIASDAISRAVANWPEASELLKDSCSLRKTIENHMTAVQKSLAVS